MIPSAVNNPSLLKPEEEPELEPELKPELKPELEPELEPEEENMHGEEKKTLKIKIDQEETESSKRATPGAVLSLKNETYPSLFDECKEEIPGIKEVDLTGCFKIDYRDKEFIRDSKGIPLNHIYLAYIDNNKEKCECEPISSDAVGFADKRDPKKCKSVFIKFFKKIKYKEVIGETQNKEEISESPNIEAIDEIKKLNMFHHPNILEFYGIYKMPTDIEKLKKIMDGFNPIYADTVAVFERGLFDLQSGLEKYKGAKKGRINKSFQGTPEQMNFIIFKGIATDIFNALDYIHKQSYVHLDLKPENICIFKVGKAYVFKIIDFGSCGKVDESLEIFRGTFTIAPPEALVPPEGFKAALSYDYYSFGVILYFIYKGHLPLNSKGREWRKDMGKTSHHPSIATIKVSENTMKDDHSIEAKQNRKAEFEEFSEQCKSTMRLYNIIEGLLSIEPGEREKYMEEFRILITPSKEKKSKAKSKKKKKKKKKKSKKKKKEKEKEKKTKKK